MSKIINILLLVLVLESLLFVSIQMKRSSEDEVQTCSKDDEVCRSAQKAKESVAESATKASPSTDSDTSTKKSSTSSGAKSTSTKTKSKSKKSKSEDDIADCPLCSYTRPLIRHIIDWINDLLSAADPMLLMLFQMVKDKVWELGNLTKQLIGFRLF